MYLEEYIRSAFPEAGSGPPVAVKGKAEGLDRLTDDPSLQSLWGIFQEPKGQAEIRRIARRENGGSHWIFEKEY